MADMTDSLLRIQTRETFTLVFGRLKASTISFTGKRQQLNLFTYLRSYPKTDRIYSLCLIKSRETSYSLIFCISCSFVTNFTILKLELKERFFTVNTWKYNEYSQLSLMTWRVQYPFNPLQPKNYQVRQLLVLISIARWHSYWWLNYSPNSNVQLS